MAALGCEDQGPFTLADLSQRAQSGAIQPSTQIKCPGGIVVPASMVSGIEGLSRTQQQPLPQYTGSLPYAESIPREMSSGFNFGAFFATWIWGLIHRAPMSLLALALDLICVAVVAFAVIGHFLEAGIGILWVGHFPMMVWFGIQGNRWAWKSEKYESAEACKAAQKKWAWAGGIGIGLIGSVAFVALVYYLVTTMNDLGLTSSPGFGGE